MYRIFCTDLDGTLLNTSGRISTANRRALEHAREAGIHIILASGRDFNSIRGIQTAADIGGYCVCLNGSLIVDGAGHILQETPIPSEVVHRLVEIGEALNVVIHLNAADTACDYRNLSSNIMRPVLKVGFEGTDRQVLNTAYEGLHEVPIANCMWADETHLEIVASGVSKASAVHYIAKHLGVKMTEVAACGDYENDLSLLQAAGLGIAMDNALPNVLDVADEIVDNTVGTGVAGAIARVLSAEYDANHDNMI